MPEDSPASTPENQARGILLVEPYDALSIALSSALRKFATHHAIRVTPTLADAAEALETIQPELFVLDLDPAPGGEVEFFNRLRRRHPNTRVIVIAAGTSPELREARGLEGAMQFLEKPFDLGEFGATVQALLGPWAKPSSDARRGTLRDLHLLDIVQLKCLSHGDGVVRLATAGGEIGEIHFRRGEIFHAATGELVGRPALEEMMRWPGGEFSDSEESEDTPGTIDKPWAALLREIVAKVEIHHPDPPDDGEPVEETAEQEKGKVILVIDDTEMLRIFVADVLATADRTFQVITAATGQEGLRLAQEKHPELILLDYSLTDMNGDEVCRGLLAQEETATIPVLMMSGHLPEMAHTAESYGNVVATLAKPFLSGALIEAVEKMLAEGPRPVPPAPIAVPPTEAQPEPPTGLHVLPSPNGHAGGAHGELTPASSVPAPAPFSPPPPTPVATQVLTAPEPSAPPPPPSNPPVSDREKASPSAVAAEQREVIATLSCEVSSVQLAPDFRMGAMQLRPGEETITLRMDGFSGSFELPPERDFRMGTMQLSAEGRIATWRIIPTPRAPHLVPSGNDFAVDRVSAEDATSGRLMELTGTQGGTMRVLLIIPFQLLNVELSTDFEVAAVILQSHSNGVRVQTGEANAAPMQFYVQDVQLDDSGRLASLTVGSRH